MIGVLPNQKEIMSPEGPGHSEAIGHPNSKLTYHRCYAILCISSMAGKKGRPIDCLRKSQEKDQEASAISLCVSIATGHKSKTTSRKTWKALLYTSWALGNDTVKWSKGYLEILTRRIQVAAWIGMSSHLSSRLDLSRCHTLLLQLCHHHIRLSVATLIVAVIPFLHLIINSFMAN